MVNNPKTFEECLFKFKSGTATSRKTFTRFTSDITKALDTEVTKVNETQEHKSDLLRHMKIAEPKPLPIEQKGLNFEQDQGCEEGGIINVRKEERQKHKTHYS